MIVSPRLVFVLVFALSVGAAVDARGMRTLEAIETLRAGDRLPTSRAAAVDVLSDLERPLSSRQLAPLLVPQAPWSAQLDAAEVAARREDPALASLMFRGFIESKATRVAHDPDVFERLLRALQRMPPQELVAALEEAEITAAVGDHSEDRLTFHWLDPLDVGRVAGSGDDPWVDRAVERHVHRWVVELAQAGDHGFVTLQSDSGDLAFHLVEDLELLILAGQVLDSGPELIPTAAQVCMHRRVGRVRIADAFTSLRDVGRPFTEADDFVVEKLLREVPETTRKPTVPDRVRPVEGSVDAEPWTSSPTIQTSVAGVSAARLVGGVVVLFVLLLVLAAGLRPATRRFVFPVAALCLAPLLLGAVEWGLGWAGVQPLGAVRPTFNPTNAPETLLNSRTLEGESFVVTTSGRTRFAALPAEKAPSELRVVALGASSVHGSNYLREEAWPAVLEQSLRRRMPDHEVSVLNLGTGGAVSDEVFFHAREAIRLVVPDLLVLSLGYNDFIHLADLSAYRAYDPGDLRLRFELDRWRIVRALSELVPRFEPKVEPTGAYLDVADMTESELAAVRAVAGRSLQSNVERIVGLARQADVDVIILVQAQNEDLCGADGASGSTMDRCFPAAARSAVIAAARRDGVLLVDSVAALRAHASGGPVGSEYFWDRIHASRLGHAVLGEALAPRVARVLRTR